MELESLLEDVIQHEKKIALDDTIFYAISDKKGKKHYFAYNDIFILYENSTGEYKIAVKDPDSVKLNLRGHPPEYRNQVKDFSKRKKDIKILNFAGVERVSFPGVFGEIVDYISTKVPIIGFTEYFESTHKRVIRIYDEIKKTQELLEEGSDTRKIADKLYEISPDISHRDLRLFGYNIIARFISAKSYLKKHPELEQILNDYKNTHTPTQT